MSASLSGRLAAAALCAVLGAAVIARTGKLSAQESPSAPPENTEATPVPAAPPAPEPAEQASETPAPAPAESSVVDPVPPPPALNEAVREIPDSAVPAAGTTPPLEFRPATPVEEVKVPKLTEPALPNADADLSNRLLVPTVPETGALAPIPMDPAQSAPLTSAADGASVSAVTELTPSHIETPLTPETLSGPDDGGTPAAPSVAPWTLSLETKAMYDDNIFLSGRDKRGDFVFTISPAVQWREGDAVARKDSFADLKYRATGILFGSMSSENTVDHDARAAFAKRFGRGTLGADLRYVRRSDPTPDLGGRITRGEYSGVVSATVELSDRTDIEVNAKVNSVRYAAPGWSDYDEWVVETFAGYKPSGRTRIAAGLAAGRLNVRGQGGQNFTRGLVKVSTDATGAVTLRGSGGVEFRKTPAGDRATPVFSVAADYKPRDGTTVTLEAFRETTASGALAGENQTRTGAALRVRQRIGSRLEAAVDAGYERLSYSAASSNAGTVDREDDYLYLRPSLRYEFQEGRRAEIFYNFQRDDSSASDFSFEGNQVGILIGLEF